MKAENRGIMPVYKRAILMVGLALAPVVGSAAAIDSAGVPRHHEVDKLSMPEPIDAQTSPSARGASVKPLTPNESQKAVGPPMFASSTVAYGNWAFTGSPAGTTQMVSGDFNGDGRTDVDLLGATKHYRMISNGGGGFTNSEVLYPTGWNFGTPPSASNYKSMTGDFNGDGTTDIVMLARSGVLGTAYLMHGNATGYSSQTAALSVDPLQFHTILGDFNGDGRSDIAFVRYTDIYQYISNGNGGFTAYMVPISSVGTSALTTHMSAGGDFNGDGRTDIALVTGQTITIYLSTGRGGFTLANTVMASALSVGSTPNATYQLIAGDVNGDSKGDLNILGPTSHTQAISTGSGGFTVTNFSYGGWNLANLPTAYKVRPGDYDGDGRLDFDILGATSHYLIRSVGTTSPTKTEISFGGWNSGSPAASCCLVAGGDFNGDGKAEVDFVGADGHQMMLNTWQQNDEGKVLSVSGTRQGIDVAIGLDGARFTRTPTATSGSTEWVKDTFPGQPAAGFLNATNANGGLAFMAQGYDGSVYNRTSANWRAFTAGLPAGSVLKVSSPSADGFVYVIASDGRVYSQIAWGGSWVLTSTGLPSGDTRDISDEGPYISNYRSRLAIGSNGLVYISTQPGFGQTWSSWTTWSTGLPAGVTQQITAIDGGKHVQAIGSDGRIYSRYLSGTAYTNWTPTNTGLPAGAARAVVGQGASGDNSRHLLAIGSDGKVYRRTMDGNQVWSNWISFSAGLPGGVAVEVTPIDHLYGTNAITNNGSVYRNRWNGTGWTGWLPYGRGIVSNQLSAVSLEQFGTVTTPLMNEFMDWLERRICELGLAPSGECQSASAVAAAAKAAPFGDKRHVDILGHKGGISTQVCVNGDEAHGDNGCSVHFGPLTVIPNTTFQLACRNHDHCFQHGFDPNYPGGKHSAYQCTEELKDDAIEGCNQKYYPAGSTRRSLDPRARVARAIIYANCTAIARTYAQVVHWVGDSKFYHTGPRTKADPTQPVTCSPSLSPDSTVDFNESGQRVVSANHANGDLFNCGLSGNCNPTTTEPDCVAYQGSVWYPFSIGQRLCGSYGGGSQGVLVQCVGPSVPTGWQAIDTCPNNPGWSIPTN